MRAYLLAVFTGRRINEILMMDFDPLEAIPELPNEPDDDHAFVARLRYQQTKIDGAPNTILVERAVVNVVGEQQRWILDQGLRRLATISRARAGGGPLAPDAKPKYLFLMMQRTGSDSAPTAAGRSDAGWPPWRTSSRSATARTSRSTFNAPTACDTPRPPSCSTRASPSTSFSAPWATPAQR
jgi:hypothetical protein